MSSDSQIKRVAVALAQAHERRMWSADDDMSHMAHLGASALATFREKRGEAIARAAQRFEHYLADAVAAIKASE